MLEFGMKDQYFGDVSHYKETGILRTLLNNGAVKPVNALVCWMMTANDGSNDGFNHKYLDQPSTWRKCDPDLYDFLAYSVLNLKVKTIEHLEKSAQW